MEEPHDIGTFTLDNLHAILRLRYPLATVKKNVERKSVFVYTDEDCTVELLHIQIENPYVSLWSPDQFERPPDMPSYIPCPQASWKQTACKRFKGTLDNVVTELFAHFA